MLIDGVGLGWEVNPDPVTAMGTLPVVAELAVATARSPFGDAMRATARALGLFWLP